MKYRNVFLAMALATGLAQSVNGQDQSLSVETDMKTEFVVENGMRFERLTLIRTVSSAMPVEAIEPRGTLSPAEIRNAVQVEVDRLSHAGIDIDPKHLDGIGLDAKSHDDVIREISLIVENTRILDPDWIGSAG